MQYTGFKKGLLPNLLLLELVSENSGSQPHINCEICNYISKLVISLLIEKNENNLKPLVKFIVAMEKDAWILTWT